MLLICMSSAGQTAYSLMNSLVNNQSNVLWNLSSHSESMSFINTVDQETQNPVTGQCLKPFFVLVMTLLMGKITLLKQESKWLEISHRHKLSPHHHHHRLPSGFHATHRWSSSTSLGLCNQVFMQLNCLRVRHRRQLSQVLCLLRRI